MNAREFATRVSRTGGRDATRGVIPGRFALAVGMPDLPAPAGWRWTPLSEVAQLESGHTPSRRRPEYWNGGIPWIGIRDAVDNHGRTIQDTVQHVAQLGLENSSARLLPEGTVCLSRTASVGYVVVMGRPMATSQDFVNWVCGPGLRPAYLKYVLLAENDSLLRFASGTTHQTIYYPEAKAFHALLPPVAEQACILQVLQPLDDKIELNRRMNETLEAMARAQFKSWFVDFDAVHAKVAGRTPAGMDRATATLFPDRFEKSDLVQIPRGWRHRVLYDCATWVNGAAYRDFQFCAPGDGLPIVKIAELKAGITGQTRFTLTNPGDKYLIDTGDVLFSWSGNPDTSIDTFVWSRGRAWLNQHIFKVITASRPERTFVLWLLRHLRPVFAEIARNKQTTGLGHVTAGDMKRMSVTVPTSDVLAAFEDVIGPLGDLMLARDLESATLASMRDDLLPRLLSGALRVRDADRIVERAV